MESRLELNKESRLELNKESKVLQNKDLRVLQRMLLKMFQRKVSRPLKKIFQSMESKLVKTELKSTRISSLEKLEIKLFQKQKTKQRTNLKEK